MRLACRVAIISLAAVLVSVSGLAYAADRGRMAYASPAIRGRVVSDETGRPLAGVSVLAWWRDSQESLSLPMMAGTLRAEEAESGFDGAFVIGPWEPGSLATPVSKNSPQLMFFAAGREPKTIDVGATRQDGRALEIRMRALSNLTHERAKTLRELLNRLLLVWAPLRDQPPPRMLAVLDAEWRQLPEEAKKGLASVRPWFTSALQELRAAEGFQR